jgi:hypothetical protein
MLASKDRVSSSCADELRSTISDVALPGDELYGKGCRIWNGAVRRQPAIVAFCRRPEDVQAALRAARRHGLPLSVRAGGHDWAGRALRDGGLVIDLTGMRDVAVDPLVWAGFLGRKSLPIGRARLKPFLCCSA